MQGARVEWSAVAWRVGIVAGCRLSVAGWVGVVVGSGAGSSVRGAMGPWISSRTISSTRGSGVGTVVVGCWLLVAGWVAAVAAVVAVVRFLALARGSLGRKAVMIWRQ